MNTGDGGKGSSPRPFSKDKFDRNWDLIFGDKKNVHSTGRRDDDKQQGESLRPDQSDGDDRSPTG